MVKEKNKITAIIQARLNSSRFKNKILKKINGKEIIKILIERLKKSKEINDIIVAIPNTRSNNGLEIFLKKNNINSFRGSEKNVLKRYLDCCRKYKISKLVRITSDCPLIDPKILDKMAREFKENNFDYLSNIQERTFPDGMDIEFLKVDTLEKVYKNVIYDYDKEHVTPYVLRSNIFKKKNYTYKKDYSKIRITLDYPNDLKILKKIVGHFKNLNFGTDKIIKVYNNLNVKNTIRKKNLEINWTMAQKNIAGGNMLLSKRPEQYLPEIWPSHYKKSYGCKIISSDKKIYYDLGLMGVGTNILGYSNKIIDNAVTNRLQKGNMSSLNCEEEVLLAIKLKEIHNWDGKVKFARSGGEANAIAVRLARAYSGKYKVAFCGYHGWHDWYLATNLKNSKNLNKHLIDNLKISGVPKNLKDSIFPFKYNDINSFYEVFKKNPDIGIIKMEVLRNENPKNQFLKKIRKFATKNKIVLIFDECTTGFRQTYGGIYKIFNVEPDILILGKALGNGYAITAVLGKNEIMEKEKETFISSTFWTESIGPTAALKTLELMKKQKSWIKITKIGRQIIKNWEKIAKKNSIKIKIKGIPALCSFEFVSKNNDLYKNLITQEMLKKGYLASNVIYVSTSHKMNILKRYYKILNDIFKVISKCEKGADIHIYLNNKVSQKKFSRLN
jgi:glutamate-1-semialdehyde aminotransferase/spore coat polysaccharide biosynthesis protein SpsF (cytidylyltransferase family)